jgi:hypothetical protein
VACDIEKLLDKLDDLYIRLNTVIATTEFVFAQIVPSIIKHLECCEFHSMKYDKELNEIRVCFSYNENKTCVCVVIELKEIKNNVVRLKAHYFIQGGSCDFK